MICPYLGETGRETDRELGGETMAREMAISFGIDKRMPFLRMNSIWVAITFQSAAITSSNG
jgi:hypothetical protein